MRLDELHESARIALRKLDANLLAGLHGRSVITTRDADLDELRGIGELAEAFEALDRAGVATPLFPNSLHYAVFFDKSTRTKSSWAGASARLGAQAVIVDGSTTQVAHGETAEETGAMLGMNAHALGVRHDLILGEGTPFMRAAARGIREYLAEIGSERACPLVNLQCDMDHPTQTLADLCWLRERFGEDLSGKKVAVTWAYSPSYAKPLSVPQGLVTLLPRLGMDVRLAHPEGYDLAPEATEAAFAGADEGGGSFERVESMAEAFEEADAVYPKSWGPYDLMMERVEANRTGDETHLASVERHALERNREHTDWICDEDLLGRTRDALYMHCLPADIGDEVSAGVYDAARVDVARQANKKPYVIMALLAAGRDADVVDHLERVVREGPPS